MSLLEDARQLALGAEVKLLTIDAAPIGGGRVRLTPEPLDGGPVLFGGVTYEPLPFEITGVTLGTGAGAGEGTLEVAQEHASLIALLGQVADLRGARVTLLVTLKPYLDGQPSADPQQHWAPQQWIVQGEDAAGPGRLKWRLASPLSLDAAHLPARQALRDVCPLIYRRRDGSAWVTEAGMDGGCPWRGTRADGGPFFDKMDHATNDASLDRCSQRLTGCRARYGLGPLPFGGFPGLGRKA